MREWGGSWISYEQKDLPEFHNLSDAINKLAQEARLQDDQIKILSQAIQDNAHCYYTEPIDLRVFDKTASHADAPKPLHHMLMVYLFLWLYANEKRKWPLHDMFKESKEVLTNCLTLLFHDFVEDDKHISVWDGVDLSSLSQHIPNDRIATAENDIGVRVKAWWIWPRFLAQKSSLESLLAYLQTHLEETTAKQVVRDVWFMSFISTKDDKILSPEVMYTRLCSQQRLIFNKILDYITNALTTDSLQKSLEKKQLAADLLTASKNNDMNWILEKFPLLIVKSSSFIHISQDQLDYVKNMDATIQDFSSLIAYLLQSPSEKLTYLHQ